MAAAWLFVPADRPDRFAKALATGAARVIVDLEDAVAPERKDAAREALRGWLASAPPPVAVRLNAVDTPWFAQDLAVLGSPAVAVTVVPKADDAAVIARVANQRAGLAVVPLVESASGLAAARALAAAPGVERLAFGHIDLQVDLGLRDAQEDDFLPHRCELVLASRLAGIAAPLDGVTVQLDDETVLAQDVRRARRLGFGGKLCIHPRQVAAVNAGFAPGAGELAWARRVIDAAASANGGAVAVDGRMVDRPVLLRAQAVLRDAAP